MGLLIGIDGGGTKTRCVLVDQDLKILTCVEGGSSNPLSVGIEISASVIIDLIKRVLTFAEVIEVDAVVIGSAGAGRKKNAKDLKRAELDLIFRERLSIPYIEVVSDAEIAIEGAFAGNPGAILIAGTGSIIFGKDKKGNIVRSGGFGKIIGDEGGGYSIGRKGLNRAAKLFDGKYVKSTFINLLHKNFGINDLDSLILKVYSDKFDIASTAGLVIEAAGKGDKICRKILDEESDEFLYYIMKFKQKFKQKTFKLCFSGGLLTTENYYSKMLKSKIKKNFNEIEFVKPIYPPEVGAAILANKLLHTPK
jgi:N-acetylglucosamine kinase-like BadF-type ATPase